MGGKKRGLLARFLKGTVVPIAGSMRTRRRPIDFLAKEILLNRELARKGWEYYTANRIWRPNAETSLEGLKFTMEICAE